MKRYENLIEDTNENRELIIKKDSCDKYDYMAAVACGAIGGLIDIFFVGSPLENNKLMNFTDEMTDNAVKKFAKMVGWNPREEQKNNVKSAIGFLEGKFSINYDQRTSKDVGDMLNLSTKDHHFKSLGHSPDIVGLFFSVLNQFTSTSTFISDGKLITVDTDTYNLKGGNFISKIFCGVANWFGHLMSDVAGSSGAKGRGSGINMPFYELFGFCKFGNFKVEDARQDFATIAERAFKSGYDFRFGLSLALPVIMTDLLIRLVWALRRRFQYNLPVSECIPSKKYDSLRVMLIFGTGTLCVVDGLDAVIKSGGNFLIFFMRLNLIAWMRLVAMVAKEIFIRLKISANIQKTIDCFKRINEGMMNYLEELKTIDIQRYKIETEKYNMIVNDIEKVDDDYELNNLLLKIFDDEGIEKSWQGDFDEFMEDDSTSFTF